MFQLLELGSIHFSIVINIWAIIIFFFPDGGGKNKRYYATEADDLGAPLAAGWRRETTIREYTKSGIRGEVVYVAPCGKRFKQYPDIIRVSWRGWEADDDIIIISCAIALKWEPFN